MVTYTTNTFPIGDYIPAVFDDYNANLFIDGTVIYLSLWDTAGQEEYDRLRPLAYPQTSVFVCLFSVVCPSSFENVAARWHPELSHHCPGVPIVLVGSKADLREDLETLSQLQSTQKFPIGTAQGEDMMRSIGAFKYLECSALRLQGVRDIFDFAVRASLSTTHKKKGGGCVFI
uniref:Uncharacterized protein n=1 Tax=Arcella intermedia TaxID=1963864 RepID=A0A6B2LJV8_9EUKA